MDRREWTADDYREYARDVDTGKEVSSFQPYIEHDPHGTSETVYERNSAFAPEPTPDSNLEVHMKQGPAGYGQYEAKSDQSPTIIAHKPLPPAPYESDAPSPAHNGSGSAEEAVEKKRGMSRKKIIIIAAVVGILAIVAIVVGAVVGTRNNGSKDEAGNQDEHLSSSDNTSSSTSTQTPEPTPTTPTVVIPTEDEVKIGSNFTASITFYGSGDGGDGETCKSSGNACGIFPESGFAAGVSQNLYGDGITCGSCWRVRATHDGGGSRLSRDPIIVKVNEMCPAEGYPICGQRDLRSTNQFKMQVNFNLCIDTGAADALFGINTGVDFATGSVERVDCKQWKGKSKETFRF